MGLKYYSMLIILTLLSHVIIKTKEGEFYY